MHFPHPLCPHEVILMLAWLFLFALPLCAVGAVLFCALVPDALCRAFVQRFDPARWDWL